MRRSAITLLILLVLGVPMAIGDPAPIAAGHTVQITLDDGSQITFRGSEVKFQARRMMSSKDGRAEMWGGVTLKATRGGSEVFEIKSEHLVVQSSPVVAQP